MFLGLDILAFKRLIDHFLDSGIEIPILLIMKLFFSFISKLSFKQSGLIASDINSFSKVLSLSSLIKNILFLKKIW